MEYLQYLCVQLTNKGRTMGFSGQGGDIPDSRAPLLGVPNTSQCKLNSKAITDLSTTNQFIIRTRTWSVPSHTSLRYT